MLDKYEVAKTIGEEFNYPWIEEMNCFDGFPEVLKNEDGTDIEGCDWYMGEGLNDFGTFIDIEVDMTPELREAAQHWYGEMRFDEDEFGNYLQVDYDTAEEMAVMRNDDTEEEDYDPGNDHIQILLKSQTHLRQLAEGIKAYNKEFPAKPKSKEETLETIRNDGNALANVDDSLKADREFMLEAVKSNGRALKYASDSLKADREVVLEAVKNDAYALQYASDTLKADREVVLEAVETSVAGLEYADDSLKADREIVLEAVKRNGNALQFADDSLKADCEVVLEAAKSWFFALQYADDSLKADREIVLEAVRHYGGALQYADDSLKADREIVLEAVKSNGRALKHASEELQNDPELKKLAED